MTNEKKTKQIMFSCSPEFKEALRIACEERKVDISLLIRVTVASAIGYDLETDSMAKRTGRPAVYKNTDEAKAAAKTKRAQRKKAIEEFMNAVASQEREEDILALRNSLENRIET